MNKLKLIICLTLLTIGIGCSTSEPGPVFISEDFPYEAKFIEVLGSNMRYIDKGKGDVFLFLHGNPMSMYYWRKVMPHLESYGRVVAVDLIGMGKSDKPNIDYRFLDHAKYLEAFISKMQLTNITIVGHDWGSGLEFYYATRHKEKIKGLAFMEAVLGEEEWSDYPQDQRELLQFLRSEDGKTTILKENVIVEPGIQDDVLRSLTEKELDTYKEPFLEENSRYLIWRWVTEVPTDGEPADVSKLVEDYMIELSNWDVPKLLIYADPGNAYSPEEAQIIAANLPNCEAIGVGAGLHYLVEDKPNEIGKAIAKWYEAFR